MRTKVLVDRLEIVIGIDGAPRHLLSAIETELAHHFGLPAIQASERAEVVEAAVALLISERAAASERAGTTPILSLLGSDSDIVAGFCYVLAMDPTPVVSVKKQRVYAKSILSAIRKLSFTEFEKFGARILTAIGSKDSRITPHGGDQGIDFFGHLSVGQFQALPPPFVMLAHDIVISLVGQAKHYPNSALGPEVVRELIGAISLARTKTFSRLDLDIFRELELRPFSPLVTLVFTTGKITAGAAELARSAGITARSGEQLAVFLADKGVGMVQTASGPAFDEEAFSTWVNAE